MSNPLSQKLLSLASKLKGLNEILYPGENKFRRYKKNYKSDIKIPKNIMEDIQNLLE